MPGALLRHTINKEKLSVLGGFIGESQVFAVPVQARNHASAVQTLLLTVELRSIPDWFLHSKEKRRILTLVFHFTLTLVDFFLG